VTVQAKTDVAKTPQPKTVQTEPGRAWIASVSKWLTPSRIRAQAIVLALCLWGVCAIDFATPDLLDRAGNIKFQDFLPSYIAAQLIAQGHAAELYNERVTATAMQAIVAQPTRVRLPNLYGPQVGLFFAPLARFSFPVAARIWVGASLLVFAVCIYLIWNSCPNLRSYGGTVFLCAIAFPPLFHFFVRAQMSAVVLACFTSAFLAFRKDRSWLAGVALGFLFFKPQFLIAIPLVLLLSQAWKPLIGLVLSASAQLLFARIYFGPALLQTYFDTLRHISQVIGGVELSLAPIQMHSLRSFWTLLIPWPEVALAGYALSSILAIAIAAAVWRSSPHLAIRFSALTLAAVLVNPHLFVYDLLVLSPVVLLLVAWAVDRTVDCNLTNAPPASLPTLNLLLYLVYILPLFGPLSRWTHVQVSVPAFAALLWLLWRLSIFPSRQLAANECSVV
jgi:Glycosyltransferase family 87